MNVGDLVMIRRGSRFYGTNRGNPAHEIGIIVSISSGNGRLPIRVEWVNSLTNIYGKEDLLLLK